MEATFCLGSFVQAACHCAPATDQARSTVAQGEKAVSSARTNGALEYLGIEGLEKAHSPVQHSVTPLLFIVSSIPRLDFSGSDHTIAA